MKQTKSQLQERVRTLEIEREAAVLMLNDLLNHRTTRFARGSLVIHVARPTGAGGGLIALKQNGVVYAHYFEDWFEKLRRTIPRPDDTELIALRDLGFEVNAFIKAEQAKLQ